MSPDQEIRREMQQRGQEPLLPIEKKLILGSICFGLILLVFLAIASRFVPAS